MITRSVGLNVLTTNEVLADHWYGQLCALARDMRPSLSNHISVYQTAVDDSEPYAAEGAESPIAVARLRKVLFNKGYTSREASELIEDVREAGIVLREVEQ